MGFEVIMHQTAGEEQVEIQDRLCLTEDERLVPEGDPDGRWLYAVPGQRVPLSEAVKYGLVKGEKKPGADKSRKTPAEDKAAKAPVETPKSTKKA